MPTPKKLKPVTKETVEIGKRNIVAEAKGELASAVIAARTGQKGIAGQPEGQALKRIDKAKQRLLDINKSVAEYGRWENRARTDIKGYNPKKK